MPRTAHPHFANALCDLKTRFNASPADLTPEELFALVEAVKRVESPFDGVNMDAVGFPAKIADGIYLWKLTAGASAWLDAFAAKWWGGGEDDKKYFWALVYALANARRRDAFVELDTPGKAYRAIRKFMLSCPATEDELKAGIDAAMSPEEDDRGGKLATDAPLTDGAVDWARLCARLETQSGIKQDDWLWGRSASYLSMAYKDLAAFAATYSAASGGNGCPMRDELDKAMEHLAKTVVAIGKRIRATRDEMKAEAR